MVYQKSDRIRREPVEFPYQTRITFELLPFQRRSGVSLIREWPEGGTVVCTDYVGSGTGCRLLENVFMS